MTKNKTILKYFLLPFMALIMCLALVFGLSACNNSDEDDYSSLDFQEYDATLTAELAMGTYGSFSFGRVLTGAYIAEKDGTYYLKMTFSTYELEIMSVKTTAFVDASPEGTRLISYGLDAGTIGYYNEAGELITEGVEYSLSTDTVTNSNGDEVNYVTEIIMPVDSLRSEYSLALFINSDTTGVQFSELVEGQTKNYSATLEIDLGE